MMHVQSHTVYSTLLKIQERKSDRRSKEIEQRKKSQNKDGHVTLLHYNIKLPSSLGGLEKIFFKYLIKKKFKFG